MANPQHIEWLLEGVEAWNERRGLHGELCDIDPDFSSIDVHASLEYALETDRPSLAGYDLTDTNFIESRISDVNFTKVDLAGANLSGTRAARANLSESNLQRANLANAQLWWANFTGANLHNANLTNAELKEAKVSGANFIEADLTGADLSSVLLFQAALYRISNLPDQYAGTPNSVSSIGELLAIISQLNAHYKEHYGDILFYFRGESQSGWDLSPSVMRDNDLAGSEGKMLIDLISQCPEEFSGQNLAIAQWVLAQHYGLKTRFLDITSNPLVALFHACTRSESAQITLADGLLHIFAAPLWMVKPFNSDTISVITNFAKLSQYEQRALTGRTHWFFSPTYSEAMDKLYQLIRAEKSYFAARIDPRDFYRVFVVEPQQSSERIRAQSGAFLVSAFHERFEREEILKRNERIPVYSHYTLTIPHDCKEEIMQDLRLLNITRETLFPGLDSSADAVTERYKRGPAN